VEAVMRKIFLVSTMPLLSLNIALSPPSFAQDWGVRGKVQGTIKVVDLQLQTASLAHNYAEGLMTLDKDNNWVPCLAKDWRWIDDKKIEFKLREDVRFHNGETFNAEAVRVNWESYRSMENPRAHSFTTLPDATLLQKSDDYTVRFTLPEPDGLAFVKFRWFFQIAPAFFMKHKFDEYNWGRLPEAGPWGTGPFELVEGSVRYARPSRRVVLEAYEGYWDRRYPKVRTVIFDNALIGDREVATRLCRENEGLVDILSHIRPLDTLKVAESPFAKVVKSKDVTWLRGIFNMRKRDSK
jgi:peptide/nickel transport system substrate-binding protein